MIDRRRWRARAVAIALTGSAVIGVAITGPDAPVAATESVHFVERTVGAPGPLGSVTFLGDSVGIGAGRFHPSLDDHLRAMGWGPIRFHAVDGGRTGYPPGWPDYFNAVPLIDQWQAAGWDSDAWIVNLGTNDSGYCGADVACAKAAIMKVVDAIGPGHRIWWVKITRFPLLRFQADAWNAALDQVDAARDDVWTWDWPSEMAAHPDVYASYDNTHLYPDGYRRRSAVMAQAFTASIAAARRVSGDEPVAATTAAPGAVLPLEPTRLIDTRTDPPGRLAAGRTLRVTVPDLPPGSTAVAVNVAAVDPAGPGFVRARRCDRTAETTMLNVTGTTRAAGAIVPVSTSGSRAGELCLDVSVATDLVVDLQAAVVPPGTDGATRLDPLTAPRRLLDTRVSGTARSLRVPVPAGSDAVTVNLTATGATRPGFVAAFPCGSTPGVSNVNVFPGQTIAAAAVVRARAGAICLRVSNDADVIVDLTGTLSTTGRLAYVAAGPARMLDTRDGTGGWSPVHGARQRLDVGVAPADAEAVTGTLVLVAPVGPGYLTALPCDAPAGRPATSTVNAAAGDVVANSTTVAIRDGRVCLQASTAGQTVFDVTGWWVAT